MTEAEWLECRDPQKMLDFLRGKASNRKLRLFLVASCLRALEHFYLPELQEAVEWGELYTDGHATEEDLAPARETVVVWMGEMCETLNNLAGAVAFTVNRGALNVEAGQEAVRLITAMYQVGIEDSSGQEDYPAQCHFLRDLFAFRPVFLDPAWLTPSVKAVAQGLYEAHRFEDLPILADALEEAGCASREVLEHCRSPGPHVRGCWVVDLILGKG